jgi:hypothetical protein
MMGPYIWDTFFQENAVPPEQAPYGYTVLPNYTLEFEELNDEQDIFLLPGGRYLFSSGSGETYHCPTVTLWDLGVPGQPAYRSPLLLAQYNFGLRNESHWTVRLSVYVPSDTDGLSFRGRVQVLVIGLRSFGIENKFL